MKEKIYVFIGGDAVRVKKYAVVKNGWLHYELADGTIGLTKKWTAAENVLVGRSIMCTPTVSQIVKGA